MSRKSFKEHLSGYFSDVDWDYINSFVNTILSKKSQEEKKKKTEDFILYFQTILKTNLIIQLVLMAKFFSEIIDILSLSENINESNYSENIKFITNKINKSKTILNLIIGENNDELLENDNK